jgi:hypothetical protein
MQRQLRFALFLQIAGSIMFLVAAIVRLTSFGIDALTIFFGVAAVIAGGVAIFTWEQLRRIRSQ